MGCTASVSYPTPKIKVGKTYIDHTQSMLVRKTWHYLSGDMTGIGSKVFLSIFKLHPAVKELFPCRDKEGDELLKDENFKGHASRFMQAVGAVVDNIKDLDESMTPLMIGLGRQHIHFSGFVPENFDAFTESMLLVWAEELKWRFTAEARDAWLAVFNFIMMKLKEGYALAYSDR